MQKKRITAVASSRHEFGRGGTDSSGYDELVRFAAGLRPVELEGYPGYAAYMDSDGMIWIAWQEDDGQQTLRRTSDGAGIPWSPELSAETTMPHEAPREGRSRRGLAVVALAAAGGLVFGLGSWALKPSTNETTTTTPSTATTPTTQPTATPSPSSTEPWVIVVPETTPVATPTQPSAPTRPTPSSSSKTPSLDLNLATWNTYKKNPNHIGEVVRDKLSEYALIGLQETRPKFKELLDIACDTCSYGIYPTASEKNHIARRNAIIYDKSKLTLRSAKWVQFASNDIKRPQNGMYPDVSDRIFQVAKFIDTASKQTFTYVNVHLPAYVSGSNGGFRKNPSAKSKRAIAAYKHGMEMLAGEVEQLLGQDEPVIVGGDFNVDARQDQVDGAMPDVALGALGCRNAYRQTGFAGIDSATGTHENTPRIIDYLIPCGLGVESVQIVGGDDKKDVRWWHGSDHKPVATKLVTES